MSDMPRPQWVPLKHGEPGYGLVCGCGGRKHKQAWKCQGCRTVEKRGPRMVIGVLDPVRRRRELDEARAQAVGELAILVAEQARDERCFIAGARGFVSLDSFDCNGRLWHEVLAA